jgi:RNA polymerase sigma-70 factor (ECF subfamily)
MRWDMISLFLSTMENPEECDAIRAMYEDNRKLFINVAVRITGDYASAEEVVQDAFIKIISQKNIFFETPCNKRCALIVIMVRNKAIDYMRERKRKMTVGLFDEASDNIFVDDSDISAGIEGEEGLERLIKYINALPEVYKTVFELRYMHDMDNGEIAESLGMKKETVALKLTRAKKRLRKMLEGGDIK